MCREGRAASVQLVDMGGSSSTAHDAHRKRLMAVEVAYHALLLLLPAVSMRVSGFLFHVAAVILGSLFRQVRTCPVTLGGIRAHRASGLTSSAHPLAARSQRLRIACVVALGLGSMVLGAATVVAQNPSLPESPERPNAGQNAPMAAADSFQLAQQQMNRGNYESAIALLEQLANDHPNRTTFQYELINAYEETKAYDEALAVLDRISNDNSVSDVVDRGRLQHLAGREEQARQTWEAAIALYPERASTYRSIYHTLSNLRQFNLAIQIVEEGRETLNDPAAFRTELARLYSLDGQHDAALREYVALLEDDGRRVRFVKSRLQPFLDQSGDLGGAAQVLEDAVAEHPENEAYLDLLAWLYAEQDDYDAALDAYTRLDSLRGDEGETVLNLARQAADANDFDAARRALRTTRTQFADTRAAQLAVKIEGDMAYRQWTQAEPFTDEAAQAADSAWKTYQSAIDSASTNSSDMPDAYATVWMRLAELALEVRNDPSAARTAHAALRQFQSHEAERTLLAARIALRTNDLSAARAHLDSLAGSNTTRPPHQSAQHLLALLDVHDGHPEQAQERLSPLLSSLSHDAANDAVALQTALRHFGGPDSTTAALQHYAQGLIRERQHRWAAADSVYGTIATDMPQHPLAERARYRQARVAAHLDSPAASAEALRTFATQFPHHPWADRALFHAARLLDYAENQPGEARSVYMRLLDEHPNSVFASEVRVRVRSLPNS